MWPLLLILIALLAGIAVMSRQKNLDSLAPRGGQPMSVRLEVPLYRQGDKRWATRNLGETEAILKNFGCTVCATAMALTIRGVPLLPDELNEKLIAEKGFTESGLLIWKAIEPISSNRFSVVIVDRPTHELLDKQLENGNPIIVKVLYKKVIWHWVLITGKDGNEYLIHDPLGDDEFDRLSANYRSGIFSARFLEEK